MASTPDSVGMVAYLAEAVVGILITGGLSILAWEGVRRWRAKRRARDGGKTKE